MIFWLDENPTSRRQPDQICQCQAHHSGYRRFGYPHTCTHRGNQSYLSALQGWSGHHFGNRQCSSGLSHRSVPNSWIRYQCENALHCSLARWRRTFETGAVGRPQNMFNNSSRRSPTLGFTCEFLLSQFPLRTWLNKTENPKAQILADTLNQAIGTFWRKQISFPQGERVGQSKSFLSRLFWRRH